MDNPASPPRPHRRTTLTVLAVAALARVILIVRPWPGTPANRVTVAGWEVFFAGVATRDDAEKLGHYLADHGPPADPGGNRTGVVIDRPPDGGVFVAVFFTPEAADDPTNLAELRRLRTALAADVSPGEPVTVEVCRGPIRLGPGDVPARDVAHELRP
jgi:hypothetical protein